MRREKNGGRLAQYFVAAVSLLIVAAPAYASDPSHLVALGRSDTEIVVQWDTGGYTNFTVDYLGPEWFGPGGPTCSAFPMHNNVLETSQDPVTIGVDPPYLTADTWYQIHVHALDSNGLVVGQSTNVILVKTATADSPMAPPVPGIDYIDCSSGGGGDAGGGDEGCAQLTMILLPGSVPVGAVHATIVDLSTGDQIGEDDLPVDQPLSVPEGDFRLLFTTPPGLAVTPPRRDLHLSCGDDVTLRLRVRNR